MPPESTNAQTSRAARPPSLAGATNVKELYGYQVTARLGVGARSIVYQVVEPTTRRKYALKRVTRDDPDLDDPAIEQVRTEHEVGGKVEHKNVRKCLKVFVQKKLLLFGPVSEIGLLMELVDGTSLADRKNYSYASLLDIFRQVCDGLAAMHATGFLHADLKPHNIIVGPNRSVKLVDFGQSCKVGATKNRIQGTPDYIAPEQVHKGPLDARTDIFNLGAGMYWVFTGKNIPSALESYQTAKGSISGPAAGRYPTARELNPQVPLALDALITHCCKVDRNERPADIAAVLARLEPMTREALGMEAEPTQLSPEEQLDRVFDNDDSGDGPVV